MFGVKRFSLSQCIVALVDCGRIINSFSVGTEFPFSSNQLNNALESMKKNRARIDKFGSQLIRLKDAI